VTDPAAGVRPIIGEPVRQYGALEERPMMLRALRATIALRCERWLHALENDARSVMRRLRFAKREALTDKCTQINGLVSVAARTLGLHVDELSYGFLRITDGVTVVFSRDFDFSVESLTAYWLCGDKHLTSVLLRDAGLPVPDFTVVYANSLASAFSAFEKLPRPLVVKPCFGAGGQGVTIGITTLQHFRKACYRALIGCDRLLIERFVAGRHWRIHTFDGQMISAFERLPASVLGDGKASIASLIDESNRAIVMRHGFPSAHPISLDRETRAVLREEGLTPSTVPPPQRRVVLKRICNAAAGGVTVDVSGSVHPDYVQLARRAAAVMGARLVGVDIIAPDVSNPLHESAVINEVNTTPALEIANFDISGRDNAAASVERFLSLVFANNTRRAADAQRQAAIAGWKRAACE
jgi:D-alanine-D-alanine ligase-like ATP-grasp enzyme